VVEYITPTKLRNDGALGTALGNRTDAQLLSLIRVASGLVNRACTAPRVYDFRGGTVVNEQHPWDLGNVHAVTGSKRVYPFHPPVKEVTRFQVRSQPGAAGVIDYALENLYVNSVDQYIEPSGMPIASISSWVATIPNLGLTQAVAELDYTYGSTFLITDERLSTASGDKLYFAESQFWTGAPDVEVDGVAATSGWSYDAREGSILFDAPQTGDVTISYATTLHPDIAQATMLICSDVIAQTRLNATGLQGLSGLRVLEVEMRQSRTTGFMNMPVNPAASLMLEPFKFRTFM
jgi:hypothetical protein